MPQSNIISLDCGMLWLLLSFENAIADQGQGKLVILQQLCYNELDLFQL